MEMQQVRYFLALSKVLNFTRAADICNVSQPALTRAIQALEVEFGGELIRRERGNSHLTPLGEHMLPFMQQCYDAALGAQALAKAVKSNDSLPMSLGLSCNINIAVFMPPIGELFRAYPGMQMRIRRGNGDAIWGMLQDGGVDLAIAGPIEKALDRFDRWPIFNEPMSVTVHRDHRLARQDAVNMEHLVGERFLALSGCEMSAVLLAYLTDHGIGKVKTHEVENDHDLVALLEANAGVSIMPASAPQSDRLCRPTVHDWILKREVSVYGVRGRPRNDVVATLLNLLRTADWTLFEQPPLAVVH